jgi:hypothetical protein
MVAIRREIDPVFGTTTPIKYPDSMGGATGFFFNYQGVTYLVSNRHVFRPDDFTPLEIRIWLRDYGNPTNARPQTIDLYKGETPIWHSHPESDEIDVAVLPLDFRLSTLGDVVNQEFKTGTLAFSREHFIHEAVTLNGSEVIVGYPGDFIDTTTLFPVKRNAILASPYGLDFDEDPCFVTDARMHKGTSGSPIVLNNPLMRRQGYDLPDNRDKSVYLLGVHSATYYKKKIDSEETGDWRYDLNAGWYPETIEETIQSV